MLSFIDPQSPWCSNLITQVGATNKGVTGKGGSSFFSFFNFLNFRFFWILGLLGVDWWFWRFWKISEISNDHFAEATWKLEISEIFEIFEMIDRPQRAPRFRTPGNWENWKMKKCTTPFPGYPLIGGSGRPESSGLVASLGSSECSWEFYDVGDLQSNSHM